MTARVVYQPCSDDTARKNLQTTILNPVQLSEVEDLLEPELRAELHSAYPDGKLFIWDLHHLEQEMPGLPWSQVTPSSSTLKQSSQSVPALLIVRIIAILP